MTYIKICGITNAGDAIESVRLGCHYLGFVFAKSSPRYIEPESARNIVRLIGSDVKTVGVFTQESDEVIEIMNRCNLDYAQLHGGQSESFAEKIGSSRVIRVMRVSDAESIENLKNYQSAVFYLLDTYIKDIEGGTGKTFDWSLAKEANNFGKRLLLSGGLNPKNVSKAIEIVKPFAVDVSSGVESSPGTKDHNKIKEFIENVRNTNNIS